MNTVKLLVLSSILAITTGCAGVQRNTAINVESADKGAQNVTLITEGVHVGTPSFNPTEAINLADTICMAWGFSKTIYLSTELTYSPSIKAHVKYICA